MIRRRDGRLVSAIAASPRYSTAEMVAVERGVVDEVLASADARTGVSDRPAVDAAIERRRLLELWRSGDLRSALTIATDAGDGTLLTADHRAHFKRRCAAPATSLAM